MFGSTPNCHRPAATNNSSNLDLEGKEDNFTVVRNNLLIDAVSTSVDRVDFASRPFKNPLIPSNSDNTVHDVKEFLSRPIICPSGNITWTTAMTSGTSLLLMDVPGNTMISAGTPWGNKLAGFLGFKGTLCFKLQFNCQRFQQGIALVSVLPATQHISTIRRALIESNIAYKVQLPSIRYNIAELDEVEIRVPFVSPELFYNRTAPRNWATVYVDVYSQLAGGDITGLCWCWFEDVELFYPTAMSGFVSKSKTKSRAVAFQDKEDPGGMLSQPLNTFSRAFSQVATNIPVLSSVAAPTSWFLNAAAKAASAFGFSSTVVTEERKALVPKSLPHMNNCDTNDTSDSMALTVGNKIAHLPNFAGTDIDEMALQYIVQIPGYITTFNWTTAGVYSTELVNIRVGPTLSFRSTTVTPTVGTPVTAYIFAPCGYVATSFAYWRGGMKYRFFINKTDFHTGRIVFQFAPSYNLTATNTVANNPFVYKWIWDIAESHSFEIVIPYVSSTPWMSTFSEDQSSTGSLKAFILTPLNAPPTVASSVNLLVEMCGAEDFEVAAFETQQNWCPIIAYSGSINPNRGRHHRVRPYVDEEEVKKVQSLTSKRRKRLRAKRRDEKFFIEAQGPLSVEQDTSSSHMAMPSVEHGSHVHDVNSFNALYTTGESVKSLRQLLKRTSWFYSRISTTGTDIAIEWDPFISYISTTFQAGSQSLLPTNLYTDIYTKFTSMFALYRGGVIIRTLSGGGGISHATMASSGYTIMGITTSEAGALNGGFNCTDSRVVTLNQSQGALDVLVPYYSRTASSPVIQPSAWNSNTTDTRAYANHINLHCYSSTIDSMHNRVNYLVGRQVADDFSLGGFLGVLPLYGETKTFP